MPSPSEVARDHYRRQALIARAASGAVEALWRQVDQADLDGSFAALGPRMVERVALGSSLPLPRPASTCRTSSRRRA